jgi:hypothetical protein
MAKFDELTRRMRVAGDVYRLAVAQVRAFVEATDAPADPGIAQSAMAAADALEEGASEMIALAGSIRARDKRRPPRSDLN